jgi:hypothetical protein
MLAQSLVEYSALSTVSESFRRAMYSVQDVVGSLTATQWAVVGAVIVLGLVLKGRRASR